MTNSDVIWIISTTMAEIRGEREAWENWKGEAHRLVRHMCEINGGEWNMDDYREGFVAALVWWRDQATAKATSFPLGGVG